MWLSHSARASLSGACHALGGVWLVAGVLRLIFGVSITFPLLPPVDLARVSPGLALAVGGALVTVGAWLRRAARVGAAASSSQAVASDGRRPELPAGAPSWDGPAQKRGAPIGIHTPSA